MDVGGHSTESIGEDLLLLFFLVNFEFKGFCFDEIFQNLAFSCLGISVIHHLIKQFIDHNEIISHGLLFEFLKILNQYIDQSMNKLEYNKSISILFGDSQKYQVIMVNIEKCMSFLIHQNRLNSILIILK